MDGMKEPVLVIGGFDVIEDLDQEFDRVHSEWVSKCSAIKAQFKQKTSRMEKAGHVYEYTKWYREKSNGGLECVGSTEPDFKKLYPAEPKPSHSFKFCEYDGHLIIDRIDYESNQIAFKNYLVFKLQECINMIHPLYSNPDKALKEYASDSVHSAGMSSERSPKGAVSVSLASKISGLQPDRKCETEKDENGRCIVLTGMSCSVLCCRECQKLCNSRCSSSYQDATPIFEECRFKHCGNYFKVSKGAPAGWGKVNNMWFCPDHLGGEEEE